MSDIHDTQPNTPIKQPEKRSLFVISLLIVLLILAVSLIGGYQAGLKQRQVAASQILEQQLDEAYILGIKAIDSHLYQVALQHFQYILTQDPNYPGAQDKLVEILLALKNNVDPLETTTVSITATPDTRAAETIFEQAKAAINNQDWGLAIETLDALRKNDATYRVVEVDGMYYISLIHRGESKLANQSCDGINLEGGIYDLTLAERFGPLDNYARGLRTWARLYITGASFWEIDWNQALFYFDQLYLNMPYMMDSSCMTSTQRYRFAAIKYADTLLLSGDACGAKQYYDAGLGIPSQDNPLVDPTATFAWDECNLGEQSGGGEVLPTVDAGTMTPSPSPTLEITITPTP